VGRLPRNSQEGWSEQFPSTQVPGDLRHEAITGWHGLEECPVVVGAQND